MKTKTIKWISAICIALTIISCKKYPAGVGPEFYRAPSNFAFLDTLQLMDYKAIKTNSPNFSTLKTFYFKGTFSHRVDWTITIKCTTSNAMKIIKGSSQSLDSINSKWTGGHTGGSTTFFKRNDVCIAEISFLGTSLTFRDTFTVNRPRGNFNTQNVIVVPFSNFETTPALQKADWWNQFTFPQNIENNAGISVNNPLVSLEGNKYFMLTGTPAKTACDETQYFCGAVQHRFHPASYDSTKNFFLQYKDTKMETKMDTWTNPEDVYVNVYIYNYGTAENVNSKVSLQMHEADLSNNANKPLLYYKATDPCNYANIYDDVPGYTTDPRAVPKNCHDPKTDDSWEAEWLVSSLNPGWNLLSKKYSELSPSLSKTNGGSGNRIKEPNRIHRVQVALISTPANKKCTMAWEFLTITKGKPFNPDDY